MLMKLVEELVYLYLFFIVGIKCHSGESFLFITPIVKTLNITDFMINIQDIITNSLKFYIHTVCKLDLSEICSIDSITKYSGQILLCSAEIVVTKLIEDAIPNCEYLQVSNIIDESIQNLVEILNNLPQKYALLRVHQLLIYLSNIKNKLNECIEKNITDKNSFEWSSQIKTYLRDVDNFNKTPEEIKKHPLVTSIANKSGLPKADLIKRLNVVLSSMHHEIKYGYEHSPSFNRIVLTPSLLKVTHTLYLSFYYHYNTIIHGSVVSGKYSIFENLSNVLGYFTTGVPCSQDLTIPELYRLIGLATIGPFFVCLRNIDKLTNDILSTLGCALQNIYLAIKLNYSHIDLNGIKTKINRDGQLIFTLQSNTQYTTLPESLKFHTRVISVVKPSFYEIVTDLFYSYGFKNPKDISYKVASIFRHLNDYYPPINNHIFNLRGLTTVISNAGLLHFNNPLMSHDDCVYEVLKQYIFSAIGTTLTDSVIDMLRLEFNKPIIKRVNTGDILKHTIQIVSQEKGVYASARFVQVCLSISEAINSFNRVIISGYNGSGKSTYKYVTLETLQKLRNKDNLKLDYKTVYPCTLSTLQWFGTNDQPGVLNGIKSFLSQSSYYIKNIVCLDGFMDNWWLDSIPNRIYLKGIEEDVVKDWNIILEARSLGYATPALFNESAIIYTDSDSAPKYHNLIEGFFIKHSYEFHKNYLLLPFNCGDNDNDMYQGTFGDYQENFDDYDTFSLSTEQASYIRNVIEWIFPPVLQFLKTTISLSQSELIIIYNFLFFYENHLLYFCRNTYPYAAKEDETTEKMLSDLSQCDVESIAFYCLTLSLRSAIDEENYTQFSHFFYLLLTSPNKAYDSYTIQPDVRYVDRKCMLPYPSDEDLYNYVYFPFNYWKGRRRGKGVWLKWDDIVNTMPMYEFDPVHSQIIVPNNVVAMIDHHLSVLSSQKGKSVTFITPKSNGKSMALKYYLHYHENDQEVQSTISLHSLVASNDLWSVFERIFVNKTEDDSNIILSSKEKCLLYIEDLNCLEPTQNKSSTVGLLRELLDHKGWTNNEALNRIILKDLKIVFTCSSDDNVCVNLLGLTTPQIYLNTLSSQETVKIYETIISPFFDSETMSQDIAKCGRLIPNASNRIFESLRTFSEKSVTCDKIILSLRDCTRFFRSIYLYKEEQFYDKIELLRIYVFNMLQLTITKLTTHNAIDYLLSQIQDSITSIFNVNYYELGNVIDNDELSETDNLLNIFYMISNDHDDIKVSV